MNETRPFVVAYCRENKRVCPQPDKWNELWEMLPERRRIGHGWEPPLPLILVAWHHTSDLQKMLRLEEHLAWAETHHCLTAVAAFLRNLDEQDWHHLPD